MLVANHLARKGTSPKCAIFERMWTTWTKNQKAPRTKNVTSLCQWKATIFFEKLKNWRTVSYFYTLFLFIFLNNVQTKLQKNNTFFLNAVKFDRFRYFSAFLYKNHV